MIQCFEIPGRLPGMNEYTKANRANARNGARLKRDAQELVGWAIKAHHVRPVSKQVNVIVTWIEPNMRRDKDNIRSAIKFILDALVEQGILRNDGWKEIGDLSDCFMVNKKNPRVLVELEEVDGMEL